MDRDFSKYVPGARVFIGRDKRQRGTIRSMVTIDEVYPGTGIAKVYVDEVCYCGQYHLFDLWLMEPLDLLAEV